MRLLGFGFPYPSHRLRSVGLLPEFLPQFFQPPFHTFRFDLLETLSVHAGDTAVHPAAPPRMVHHGFPMDLFVETVEPVGRLSLRSCRLRPGAVAVIVHESIRAPRRALPFRGSRAGSSQPVEVDRLTRHLQGALPVLAAAPTCARGAETCDGLLRNSKGFLQHAVFYPIADQKFGSLFETTAKQIQTLRRKSS